MKTKRLLKTLLAALISVSTFTAAAHDVGDLSFELYTPSGLSTKMVICKGLSSSGKTKSDDNTIGSIIIPSGITYSDGNNYRVYAIDESAFSGTNITGVTIYWGVSTINNYAFRNCKKLTSVKLASSVQSLETDVFWGCSALKEVTWCGFDTPSITSTAFPNNSGMTLWVNYEMTKSDAEIKSSLLGSKFTNIYRDNYRASDVRLSNSTDQYGYGLTIGSSDTNGYGATRNATVTYLTSAYATINGRPTSTPAAAAGKGVTYKWTKIGQYALAANNTVTTIDLTNATNLTQVKGNAFYNSTALTKVILPKSLSNWMMSAVYGCTALTEFAVHSDNSNLSAYSGCLYDKSQSVLYQVPQGKSGNISFPSTLQTVYQWAFYNCTKVTDIYLPYGVKNIQAGAFYGTTGLDYVKIPSSVTSLSNDRVFYGTQSNNYIYCNMANPPTVIASSYFGPNSSMRIYVPYGTEQTYKDAGWTGFNAVNNDSRQAYDISGYNLGFTVTSTSATTVNGKSYNGTAKVVCYNYAADNSQTTVDIPASVTAGGKSYAVTMIGEDAFNNHTSNFTVTGCENVQIVGESAFLNQQVISYPFTHTLRTIGNYAFCNTAITGTIALPYGVNSLGNYAFGNGKYSRIIIPGSLNQIYGTVCKNTKTLTEFIFNLASSVYYNYSGWDFTDVPSNCYIRVPMGVVNQWKNGALKSRAAYITGGAYDFAYDNEYTGRYFLTITSTNTTTYKGTTYAGKAKYVYHPNIKASTMSSTYGWTFSEQDRTVSNDKRAYLITELGDSLLAGVTNFGIANNIPETITRIGHDAFYNASKVNVANLVLPDGLTYIGDYAFNRTKLSGEIKIPASVTYIGKYVFNSSRLNAIYFPGAKPSTLGTKAWGTSNAIDFTVWVPNEYANGYLTTANGWGADYAKKLAVWIKPYATTQAFSSVVPTDLQGSNITAYYASAYDKNNSTAQVTLSKANMAPENTGLLLVDMETSKEYRIKRPATNVSAPMTNYLVATPTASVNVYGQTVGYYWDYRTPNNLRFVRPTSNYTTAVGSAYLKLSSAEASGLNEVYTNLWPKSSTSGNGDVNGDNKVDVEDVNAVINIILKVKTASSYPGNADVTGDGKIDVEDVNAIINIILKVG